MISAGAMALGMKKWSGFFERALHMAEAVEDALMSEDAARNDQVIDTRLVRIGRLRARRGCDEEDGKQNGYPMRRDDPACRATTEFSRASQRMNARTVKSRLRRDAMNVAAHPKDLVKSAHRWTTSVAGMPDGQR